MKRYWFILILFVGAVLALNYWCLPAYDELGYTFQGEGTPIDGVAHHIQNLKDIVNIQIADYQHGPNGRVFLHSVVCLFSGWELYTLFDFVNTGVWFLLVWLVLRAGGVKVDSVRKYVGGAAICFLFLWYAETCCYNAAFAINYLWSACLTIGFVNLWRKCDGWWLVPIGFLYGWWQEVFSMPMIAALGSCGLVAWIRSRRFPWSVARCFSLAAMVLGGIGCCGSHLISGRAAKSGGEGLAQLAFGLAKAYLSLMLGIWPIVLILAVLMVVWLSRRRLLALYDSAPEWWMYFLFGGGVYLLLGREGLRMGYPMFLAGTILLLQNRSLLARVRWRCGWLVACVAIWMVGGVLVQYRIGEALAEMERVYAADPQGVTYRRATALGLWRATASPHLFNRWHLALFKHKYRHDRVPAVLSPHLYETLYQAPETFFATAKPLGGNLFVDSVERGYLVQQGDAPLAADERELVQAWLTAAAKPSGWRRYLPGRVRMMFPASDFYLSLPQPSFSLTAKDGNRYAVHILKID